MTQEEIIAVLLKLVKEQQAMTKAYRDAELVALTAIRSELEEINSYLEDIHARTCHEC